MINILFANSFALEKAKDCQENLNKKVDLKLINNDTVGSKNDGSLPYEEVFEIAYPTLIKNEKGENKRNNREQDTINYPVMSCNDTINNPVMTCNNVVELWKCAFTFHSYEDCIKCSKKLEKPILFYFGGYGCVKCMQFQAEILNNPEIQDIVASKYIFITMITDAVERMKENECYYSELQKKKIVTIGGKTLDIQLEKFNKETQPYFVIVDKDGVILKEFSDNNNIDNFKEFLTK